MGAFLAKLDLLTGKWKGSWSQILPGSECFDPLIQYDSMIRVDQCDIKLIPG